MQHIWKTRKLLNGLNSVDQSKSQNIYMVDSKMNSHLYHGVLNCLHIEGGWWPLEWNIIIYLIISNPALSLVIIISNLASLSHVRCTAACIALDDSPLIDTWPAINVHFLLIIYDVMMCGAGNSTE